VNHAWLSEARWLDRRRIERYPKLILAIFAIAAIAWLVTGDGLRDPSGKPVGSDFIAFFTASEMALAGDAARVYDGAAVHAAERAAFGEAIEFVPWLYPPVFLLLVLPLGLLPYGWALGAWIAATLAGYLAVIRRIAPVPQAVWLALAFPAVLVNMGHGQNGFLTMALLGGAVLLVDRRPLVAGALFAALAIKPQLAILVPLALIAAGCWRTIGAAAVCVAAAAGLAAGAFGPEIFAAFAANTANAREVLEGGVVGWHKLQSVFAAFRLMGVGTTLAYLAQGVVAAAAAAAVIWVWRRPVSLAVRGASLGAATLLATPFCYDYDLVLLALPIAWIGWEGHRGGFLSWEKAVLAAAWIWPLVARQAALGLGVSLTPVVIAALLALALRRAALAEAGAPAAGPSGPSEKDNFHVAAVS
jgi:hypothetical protein